LNISSFNPDKSKTGVMVVVVKGDKIEISHSSFGEKKIEFMMRKEIGKSIDDQNKDKFSATIKHSTSKASFHKRLQNKRTSAVIDNKIKLSYVDQDNKRADNTFTDKGYLGAIPHLTCETCDEGNVIVTDIALAKSLYQEELESPSNSETLFRQYLQNGLESCNKAIPIREGGKEQFASSLTRIGTSVELSFAYTEKMSKPPQDAPIIKYVEINNTATKEKGPLKFRYGYNKSSKKVEFQGLYRFGLDDKPSEKISQSNANSINDAEWGYIEQMKINVEYAILNKDQGTVKSTNKVDNKEINEELLKIRSAAGKNNAKVINILSPTPSPHKKTNIVQATYSTRPSPTCFIYDSCQLKDKDSIMARAGVMVS
jgi:hypothetical protein